MPASPRNVNAEGRVCAQIGVLGHPAEPFTDGPMVSELSKRFNVLPFSGIPALRKPHGTGPQTESADPEGYSQSLRLAAARGGLC